MTSTDNDQILVCLHRIIELLEQAGSSSTQLPPANKEYLSLDEAATIASVCASTLRRAVRTGRLKAYNVSSGTGRPTWRILRGDLDQYVQSTQAVPIPAEDEDRQYKSSFLGV